MIRRIENRGNPWLRLTCPHTCWSPPMDILFINPNRMQPPVAPLAADSIGQALLSRGIGCTVVDLCLDQPSGAEIPLSFWRALRGPQPAAVLVTLRNLDDAYYASQESFLPGYRALVESLKKAFAVPVITGGCGFSVAPEKVLAFIGADLGVAGASEKDLLGLLGALGDRDRYPDLPGVVWKDGADLLSNAPSPPQMDADFFSPRAVVRNLEYFRRGGMVGLETKRGCTGACVYCVDPVAKGRTVLRKPIEILLEEIRSLLRQGVTVLHLCDSEFNVPPEHATEVCEAIRAEGLSERFRWYAYASPEGFDGALAQRMARAGCAGINFGVDHGRDDLLVRLGRRHRAHDLERTARAARDAGLPFMFDLLLGGPGETRRSLAEAVELCRDLGVDRVGLNVGIRVYPGTALGREVRGQGPLRKNPNLRGAVQGNEDLLHPVFFVSADLGEGWEEELAGRVGGDRRFFLPAGRGRASNYNYNTNEVLVEALKRGHKGAFWDILRRIQEGLPPLALP
ncbi:MAG: radical SAM protein [bacterium]